jgi:hypothetical protein
MSLAWRSCKDAPLAPPPKRTGPAPHVVRGTFAGEGSSVCARNKCEGGPMMYSLESVVRACVLMEQTAVQDVDGGVNGQHTGSWHSTTFASATSPKHHYQYPQPPPHQTTTAALPPPHHARIHASLLCHVGVLQSMFSGRGLVFRRRGRLLCSALPPCTLHLRHTLPHPVHATLQVGLPLRVGCVCVCMRACVRARVGVCVCVRA